MLICDKHSQTPINRRINGFQVPIVKDFVKSMKDDINLAKRHLLSTQQKQTN
jgi:hypothetical protein